MPGRVWPMQRGCVITDTYGYQGWRGGVHYGIDLGKPGGSGGLPVFAAQDGTVLRAGPAGGFGQWVTIDHSAEQGSGETVYGHVIPEIGVGARVVAGQRIARINPTKGPGNGNVAPHLHFEIHPRSWCAGCGIDPVPWLNGHPFAGEQGVPEPPKPAPVSPTEDPLWALVLDQLIGPRG